MRQERIIKQVDRMVASGRITEEEAAHLRATEGTADFDAAVGAIRARHASAHIEEAVADGEMSPQEANEYLQRLRGGDHPKGLRARLRQHRPSPHSDVAEE
jgi:polyhydroxyalkanoate synthesis regulator phasin